MNRKKWFAGFVLALILAMTAGVSCRDTQNQASTTNQGQSQSAQATKPAAQSRPISVVREPAVAGLFYPADARALSELIDSYLAKASPAPLENVRALVCPHAGYEYSGQMAAVAYKLLAGRGVSTVFILAPSHYVAFSGAYVSTADAYRTPLGLVPISPKAAALAKTSPFDGQGPYGVQRPPWWRQSPQTAPPVGQDKPDTWEHAGEVQVPFLQKVLKNFDIVPIVFGRVDPVEVTKAIEPLLDEKTVIVASSDLSHYHPYDEAKALDERCLQAVCTLNIEEMKGQEACGEAPILTVLHLARKKGWQAHLLGYCNSGDVTGNKSAVVGYGAVAFCEVTKASANEFSPQERKQLLEMARNALRQAVADGKLPQIEESTLPKKFAAAKGCFVTLTENGSLRGCIGNLTPQFPLYRAVQENARNAALNDPRFLPVRPGEVDRIEIEISVLTEPQELQFASWRELLDRLHPHTDGVILKIGGRMATYLPQVWEQIADKEAFMNSLAQKAGCDSDAWKTQPTAVFIYHVEAFKESEK